ncbi:beta-L-arabinofuranosidase domain-containing protein [Flagellimonas algicola]|nr:beta-L-arabinofuranosidase domain-containing protein [Allomuricauda algicola]
MIDDSESLAFFDSQRNSINPVFTAFATGSSKPTGWLLELMKKDLEQGIVGSLDELYPGIKNDDLYRTARRGGLEDIPEMGDLTLTGAEWEKSIMWWNAETIGNWWDGFVRHAYLVDDQKAKLQSMEIVENLLASQDDDGYIGIYKKNLRYQHEGSNGELWAQTTVFRMLLAYYEFSNEARVLKAVEKAMALTMDNYNERGRNPFELTRSFGGATHGLMLTDVCETLYRITGELKYQDYATYLYRAFSTFSVNRSFNDVRYPYLKEKDSLFIGHAVHTYEHLRSLLNAYYVTGHKELELAKDNAMHKLEQCILPSGAGHGNEWLAGRTADPTNTASEFCAMLELRNFYGSAIQKTGKIHYADQAEKLTFNAMLGSRSEDGRAITYGKPDNCYILNGRSISQDEREPRLKYSPTHSEPAVCCVPNYTRNFAYYLDQMWMRRDENIVAVLYGPSKLTTQINGVNVIVEQNTEYPFSDQIEFVITPEKPVEFELSFRKPGWKTSMNFKPNSLSPKLENGYYGIKRTWSQRETINIKFEQEIQTKELRNGEIYFQRGPLVYALPIPHSEKVVKNYELDGFRDFYCLPMNDEHVKITFPSDGGIHFEKESEHITEDSLPYTSNQLVVSMQNGDKKEKVKLKPMGNTVLRKVTFKKAY